MIQRRRSTSGALASTTHDPLASSAALPPTAASEIVKAARAYLQDPTRPVTPSEPSRHLLSSSCCSYRDRPQTSGSFVYSHDFSSAAASDGMCWGPGSFQAHGHADIWTADEGAASNSSTSSAEAGLSSSSRHAGRAVHIARHTTNSAPALRPLPCVARPSTTTINRCSSGNGSSGSRRPRAASAVTSTTGSRLAELGPLVPLAPSCPTRALQAPDEAAGNVLAPVIPTAGEACSAAPAVLAGISPGPYQLHATGRLAEDDKSCCSVPSARQSSCSTSSSWTARPSSCGGASSRGSSSCSSRSRLSSRGGDTPLCQQDAALAVAEAELAQMVLEADTAGEAGDMNHASNASCCDRRDPAASAHQWQQSILCAVQHIQSLSLSPGDAPALLQHCAELQCLLNTAADRGCLPQWLGLPAAPAATGRAVQNPLTTTQPCTSRPPCSSGQGSLQAPGGTSMQGVLLQSLVRLVDSKKPDVLVKVGAMLLGITPPRSHMLLPAAKMLYTLSKDSSNDSRFRHHGVLRPLLHTTAALSAAMEQQQHQQHTNTALLYCSGCLKNISADATNQKSLGRLGGVGTMTQVLMDQISIVQAVAAATQPALQQGQHSKHPQHEAAAQVAVQATAVLRNLSIVEANCVYFVQHQAAALQALISLLQPFQQDPEVLLNTSRCLSKLCMYEKCRLELLPAAAHGITKGNCGGTAERNSSRGSSTGGANDCWSRSNSSSSRGGLAPQKAAVSHMVHALMCVEATQPQQWPTGVRLAFALGQLTTYHAEARQLVAAVPGALDALPRLMVELMQHSRLLQARQQQQAAQTQQQQQQLQAVQAQQQQQVVQSQQPGPAEDLVTKLLRVLANLSIDRTVGPTLAAKQGVADALVAALTGYDYEAQEELVLNAVAALTNLAYYDTPSNKVLQADADVLLMMLLPLLTSGHEESMSEAARAVGNLARASPAVRAALVLCDPREEFGGQQLLEQQPAEDQQDWRPSDADSQPGGGELASSAQHVSAGPYVCQSLVLLLDHSSWEVVHSAAGALVNLAALPEAGAALARAGIATALMAALHRVYSSWGAEGVQGQQRDCVQAAQLLLQSVANVAAASAEAVSEAILGAGGPRCAELACSCEDLQGLSTAVRALADGAADEEEDEAAGCIRATAQIVQARLQTLWGI